MMPTRTYLRRATPRDFTFFRHPFLWPLRPFLPVVRRPADDPEPELGVMSDARGVSGLFGYSATVFLGNMFEIPLTETELLRHPRHVYDTFEELAADGWTVD